MLCSGGVVGAAAMWVGELCKRHGWGLSDVSSAHFGHPRHLCLHPAFHISTAAFPNFLTLLSRTAPPFNPPNNTRSYAARAGETRRRQALEALQQRGKGAAAAVEEAQERRKMLEVGATS